MRTAGIRDVKNNLSHFLRLVRGGETVLVTDRGHVVAQLGPPPHATSAEEGSEWDALARLAATGALTLGAPGPIPSALAPVPVAPAIPIDLQAALDQVRRE